MNCIREITGRSRALFVAAQRWDDHARRLLELAADAIREATRLRGEDPDEAPDVVVVPRFDGGRGGATIAYRGGTVYIRGGSELARRLCDALDPGRVAFPLAGSVASLVDRLRRLADMSDHQRSIEDDATRSDVCCIAMREAADLLDGAVPLSQARREAALQRDGAP